MSHQTAADPAGSPACEFLTNRARALLHLHRNPGLPLRELAGLLNVTERATQRIVRDLREGGYVTRRRVGRGAVCEVDLARPVFFLGASRPVGDLVSFFAGGEPAEHAPPPGR